MMLTAAAQALGQRAFLARAGALLLLGVMAGSNSAPLLLRRFGGMQFATKINTEPLKVDDTRAS